jgi:Bacterial membrane protein YfhO
MERTACQLRASARTALSHGPAFGAGTCYLALSLLYFWPALHTGAVPLPLMNIYLAHDAVWAVPPTPALAGGANRLLGDISGFYYPYLVFAIACLRAGTFPLWNPYLFGGLPFFAANQAAVLYPINLMCYWLGPQQFWVATGILRLVLAGEGMYLLLRRLGTNWLGALLGGGVYMFAAFNIVWLYFPIHNVAALLPLALWLIVRSITQPRASEVLALAALIAAQLFGGHPETAVLSLGICASVAGFFLVGQATWRRAGAALVLGLALGVGLATVQWLPTLALVRTSYTLAERLQATEPAQQDANFAPLGGVHHVARGNLRSWLLLVAPDLWGSPRGEQIRYWHPWRTNYNEMAGYIGLVTLPLVLVGALCGKHRRAAWCFSLLFGISLLLLYPLPGVAAIGRLPLLNIAYGMRFGLGIALSGAVLAGIGIDWLCEAEPLAFVGTMLVLLELVAISLAVAYDLWNGQRLRWALGFTPDNQTRTLIAAVFHRSNWRPLVPGIAGLLAALPLLAAARRWITPRRAVALIVPLALAELLVVGSDYNGLTFPAAIYPTTPALTWLQQRGEPLRLLNLDDTLWGNSAMTQGLQVVSGIDDLVPYAQRQFIFRGLLGIRWSAEQDILLAQTQRFADLMNVRYILAARPVVRDRPGPALRLELQAGALRVYRNATALPRAYATSTIVHAQPQSAVNVVFSPQFDPHRAVVVEAALPAVLRRGAVRLGPVPLVSYQPNRVELAPDLAAPAVVVLTDGFDPDWQVTIDGQAARLLRANGMFRGVLVPGGPHRIVFSYHPRLVLWGGLVSGSVLAACIAWAAGVAVYSRRGGL